MVMGRRRSGWWTACPQSWRRDVAICQRLLNGFPRIRFVKWFAIKRLLGRNTLDVNEVINKPMSDKRQLRVLHAAVSMSPSLGVIKQMEWEQSAADALGVPWRVVLHSPATVESPILRNWTGLSRLPLLRYFLLRKNFYAWLMQVEKDYDLIILRHSVHDVFEAKAAARLGHKLLTMHHTLEIPELAAHGVTGPIRAWFEKILGAFVLRRSLGAVAVTQEVLNCERLREPSSVIRPGFVYPNGVWGRSDPLLDERSEDVPELLFVASYFSAWHGLDLLIDAVARSSRCCRIHIVGEMGVEDARRCAMDERFVVHGSMRTTELRPLMARAWCGLSSFALERKGMYEACSLKVREYLDAGLSVYAGHRDSGLPEHFCYYRQGAVDLDSIVQFAWDMREVSREQVITAAEPFISKTILLDRFYRDLQQQLAPVLLGLAAHSDNAVQDESRQAPGLVALTGASGFIGKVLLEQCLLAGWRVRVLTRKPEQWQNVVGVEVVTGDLVETSDWSGFLLGVDVMVHAAAEIRHVPVMQAVNVDGPERLLRAAITFGVRRWVQLSSVGAYGPVQRGWVDDSTPERPSGIYEQTKTQFDQILRETERHSQLQVSIVRPSNVYGPGMPNQSLFQMMRMIRRRLFAYMGPTGASANYVHVNDVVSALMLCVTSPQAVGRTYIVSDWTTMENMVMAMAKGLGVRVPDWRFHLRTSLFLAKLFQWLPRWPLTTGRIRAMSTQSRYSIERITNELGWRVSVPVVRGMGDLASTFRHGNELGAERKSSLRRVLIVTYDWPPRNSIATHRPYSWARYWSAQGLEVTVLTATKKFYDLPLDLALPALAGVCVHEVDYRSLIPVSNEASSRHTSFLVGLLKRVKRLISCALGWEYDVRSAWAASADRMVKDVGADFDVVVSTYGPDSAHKIASRFKCENPSIFWVADYRDLWSQNARISSSRFVQFLTRRKELKVVRDADLFTTVSDELAHTLSNLVGKKPRVIFNGFDTKLDLSLYQNQPKIRDGAIHIVYTGRIYPGKRNPSVLVHAIEHLIDSGQIAEGDVCMHFYGANTSVINDEIPSIKYPKIICHHGHVPYTRALELQRSADLLLLLESGDEDSKGILTGKIFEYIASGRPIFSIGSTPDSAISRVLKHTGCGRSYGSEVKIIAADLRAYLHGRVPDWFKPDLAAIEFYSRRCQAELLLDKIREESACYRDI